MREKKGIFQKSLPERASTRCKKARRKENAAWRSIKKIKQSFRGGRAATARSKVGDDKKGANERLNVRGIESEDTRECIPSDPQGN